MRPKRLALVASRMLAIIICFKVYAQNARACAYFGLVFVVCAVRRLDHKNQHAPRVHSECVFVNTRPALKDDVHKHEHTHARTHTAVIGTV